MTDDPRRPGALACLRDRRVRIVRVDLIPGSFELKRVEGHVKSSRTPDRTYVVDREPDGRWHCTCRLGGSCAHELAVQMVTE